MSKYKEWEDKIKKNDIKFRLEKLHKYNDNTKKKMGYNLQHSAFPRFKSYISIFLLHFPSFSIFFLFSEKLKFLQ